jgi:D-glycero-D-manno-heptose 1,7-bisphosphate phosphatase
MKYKHVILDRDGVLNREAHDGGYVLGPEEFFWLPGTLEALAMLRSAGVYLSVATNQSGVGRGLMTLEQLYAVHHRMQTEASQQGGELGAVLFCPHAPDDGCACRKPAPGLIHEALARSGFAAAESLVVGDDRRDLEAASRAGVQAALVRTGKGRKTEMLLHRAAVPTYDDLAHVARAILEAHEHRVT